MSLKEIRRRITSVNNTRQITRAMKLVSAAKLKRAQDAAESGRSYGEHLGSIVRNALNDISGNFENPLIEKRDEVKKRLVIVITGDRGLCGGYNANVIKSVQSNEGADDIETDFITIGRRSVSAGNSNGWNQVLRFSDLPENAGTWPIDEIARKAISGFESDEYQEVVLYFTKFVSAMTQVVTRKCILPFGLEDAVGESEAPVTKGLIKYDPDPQVILARIIPLLIKTSIAQAGLEAKASEHAARMTAMDSATNNASDLIGKLRLYYNRARQAAITTELIDIVGGAEAVQ